MAQLAPIRLSTRTACTQERRGESFSIAPMIRVLRDQVSVTLTLVGPKADRTGRRPMWCTPIRRSSRSIRPKSLLIVRFSESRLCTDLLDFLLHGERIARIVRGAHLQAGRRGPRQSMSALVILVNADPRVL